MSRAKAKSFSVEPPKMSTATMGIMVVAVVLIERTSVWLTDSFTISEKPSREVRPISPRFSLTRS